MINNLAMCLSRDFIQRGWIAESELPWLTYILQKILYNALFTLLLLIWMLISNLFIETMAFVVPFYLFRSRMGGWHAQTPGICFLMSFALIITVTCFWGQLFLALNHGFIYLCNIMAFIIGFCIAPAYPVQVSFTKENLAANIRLKNYILITTLIVQGLLTYILGIQIIAYTVIGLLAAILTVMIEKIILKGDTQNDNLREEDC